MAGDFGATNIFMIPKCEGTEILRWPGTPGQLNKECTFCYQGHKKCSDQCNKWSIQLLHLAENEMEKLSAMQYGLLSAAAIDLICNPVVLLF